MSESIFRKLIHRTDLKSRNIFLRSGVPFITGLIVSFLGFTQEGMLLPIIAILMFYISWLKYDNCRTSGQVFQVMEYLADKYQRHGSILHQQGQTIYKK